MKERPAVQLSKPERQELGHLLQSGLQPVRTVLRTLALRRRSWVVNATKVYRLLREVNLVCVRKRKFVITTNSNHGLHVYPNRAAGMVLTGIDQLWLADITYIRLIQEFVYLALILDAYSRKGIGWALGRTLEATLTIATLKMALARRQPAAGLVHHSDPGVQYAASDYTDLLQSNGFVISMSRKGNPWDNAAWRVVHQDLEGRRGAAQRVPRLGRSARFDPGVYRKRSTTRNACTRRWAICRPPSSRHKPREEGEGPSPGGETLVSSGRWSSYFGIGFPSVKKEEYFWTWSGSNRQPLTSPYAAVYHYTWGRDPAH